MRWQALVLLLVVFILGIATGVGSIGLWLKHTMHVALSAPDEMEGPAIALIERVESRLLRGQSLTPEEEAAIREEFDQATIEFKQLRQNAIQDVRALAQETFERIEDRLPPDKRPALRERADEALKPWGLQIGGIDETNTSS